MKTLKLLITLGVLVTSIGSKAQLIIGQPGTFMHCDSTNFEKGINGNYIWDRISIDSIANNQWQVGRVNKTVFTSAIEAENSLVTDTVNKYIPGVKSSFTVNFSDLACSPLGIYYLIFVHSMNAVGQAGGYIEWSIDSLEWVGVEQDGCYPAGLLRVNTFDPEPNSFAYYEPLTQLYNNKLGWTQNFSNDTIYFFYSPFISKANNNFYLRFTFISDISAQPADGWMIDKMYMGTYMPFTSVNEKLAFGASALYPNPTNNVLNFATKGFKPYTALQATVYNTQGQKLVTQCLDNLAETATLPTQNLVPGLYTLQCTDGEKTLSGRFVKE